MNSDKPSNGGIAIDYPPAPRSKNDGIAIFACEHSDGVDFFAIVNDPPKSRPTCPTCGQTAKQVGHETAQRILDRNRYQPR